MISDEANSAVDIFASVMSSIGSKIASAPKDESHNFGHGKAEYIFSLFISLSMIIVSLKLIYNSAVSLFNQSSVEYPFWLFVVCISTIVVKFFLYIFTTFLGQRNDSILIESLQKDHRNDCLLTTFTLISVLLSLKGIQWFDGIVGIGISAWICKTGVEIFIESYNILMDRSIDEKTKDTILNVLHTYKEIKAINDISSAPVGYQYVLFLTIAVDGNMTTFQSHKLADKLEKDMIKLDNVYKAIIHIEPYLK